MHTKNVYNDGELTEAATCKQYLQVQVEGNRKVRRSVKYSNLDMILAIGYRVRSHIGVQFRKWATGVLTEYMKKGFVLNDARFKNPKPFGEDYFEKLLARIRDIRASEKRKHLMVTNISLTSCAIQLNRRNSIFCKTLYRIHNNDNPLNMRISCRH